MSWPRSACKKAGSVGSFQVEAGRGVDGQRALVQLQVQDVAAAPAVLGQEVKVETGHVQASGKVREAKPRQRAPRILEMENRLLLRHFVQVPIRLFLGGMLRVFTIRKWPSTRTA